MGGLAVRKAEVRCPVSHGGGSRTTKQPRDAPAKRKRAIRPHECVAAGLQESLDVDRSIGATFAITSWSGGFDQNAFAGRTGAGSSGRFVAETTMTATSAHRGTWRIGKEVPAIHHRHPQIRADEYRKLGLLLEPIKGVLAGLRLMAGVALATDELGDGLPRICVIVNYENAAHGFGWALCVRRKSGSTVPRARARSRKCTLGLCCRIDTLQSPPKVGGGAAAREPKSGRHPDHHHDGAPCCKHWSTRSRNPRSRSATRNRGDILPMTSSTVGRTLAGTWRYAIATDDHAA